MTYYRLDHDRKKIFALLMEVKSGHVQENDLERQAKVYAKMQKNDVQDSFNKHAERHGVLSKYKTWVISSFSVCFQYYDNILNNAGEEELSYLDEMGKIVHILSCKRGATIKTWKGIDIMDAETKNAYSNGIAIPMDPPIRVILNENPSFEFTAFRICQHVIDKCCSNKSWSTNADMLRNDLFSKDDITLASIEMTLVKLNQIGVCAKRRSENGPPSKFLQQYSFNDIGEIKEQVIDNLWNRKTLDQIIAEKK